MSKISVTCTKCGWVHFAVTRAEAEAEVERFNHYYDNLKSKNKERYYGGTRASIGLYESCFACANDEFKLASTDDVRNLTGCTLNPVIWEGVKYADQG